MGTCVGGLVPLRVVGLGVRLPVENPVGASVGCPADVVTGLVGLPGVELGILVGELLSGMPGPAVVLWLGI